MTTLSKENNVVHQISEKDVGLLDVIVTWLLQRFKELSKESLKDIASLIEMITNPEMTPEEIDEIFETIREILFPQLIGDVCIGTLGRAEKIPNKVETRTSWIGNKVKEIRENTELTQKELAKKSGLRQPQISRLEAGVHSPSYKTLEKIAKALSIAVGDLDPSH